MKKDTVLKILAIICGILFIAGIIWLIIAFNNMIDDHNCWIDGYQGEHCQKYIRRDN